MSSIRFTNRQLPSPAIVTGCLLLFLATFVVSSGPGDLTAADQNETKTSDSDEETQTEDKRLSIEDARRQAALLHDTYVATLHTVHRIYFDEDSRDTIPARALENVFRDIDRQTGGQTRWIAVNTPAMNIDHKPKPGFEKDAARQLARGERKFEQIKDGVYQRAGAVSLFAGCTKCHLSGIRPQRNVRSVAGLIISLPVHKE
ncbi:MAG: c-type heme family protein [Planctomycetota bacterium]|jgi:hypothetical protein